jgi:putative cell wall-binding protein
MYISRTWVLTAAHCVESRAEIYSGSTSIDAMSFRSGATGYRHPYYVDSSVRYDYGLYQLDVPAPVDERYIPRLASYDDSWTWTPGRTVVMYGWGLISASGLYSDYLQAAATTVVDDVTCASVDLSIGVVYDPTTAMCTYSPGVSGCSGDSGGPVIAQDASGVLVVVGVTSYGPRGCGLHSVAAWVPGGLTWIRSATGLSLGGGTPAQTGYEITRVFGLDRYETASAIGALWEDTSVAFVATGANFPDSLAAGAAASRFSAPVLLVNNSFVPTSTRLELERLRPQTIYVAGGPAAISDAVVTELRNLTGATITRLGGLDRYETAALLTDLAWPSAEATPLWVAGGSTFQDALIASAAAAVYGEPFILVDPIRPLSASTVERIRRLNPTFISVLGPPGGFSAQVMSTLAGLAELQILDDADVSDRSASVWYELDDSPWTSLATATNFPDALAAVPFSSLEPVAPLMLVPRHCVPTTVLSEIRRLDTTNIALFGGPAALSESVEALVPC